MYILRGQNHSSLSFLFPYWFYVSSSYPCSLLGYVGRCASEPKGMLIAYWFTRQILASRLCLNHDSLVVEFIVVDGEQKLKAKRDFP